MRAMLTTGISLAICFTLFGCGESQQQAQAPAAPAVVATTPPCNCQPAQTASMASTTVHHHRHRQHSYSESETYAEGSSSESSSYSESSSSSSVREYRPGDEEHTAGGAGAEEHMSQATNASAEAWVDGYGRIHYGDYGPIEDEHPGLISRKDERERMRPWRGYDSDCNNRID